MESSAGNCRVAAYCLTSVVRNCAAAAASLSSASAARQTSATMAAQCGSTMRTSTSSSAVAAAHVAALDEVTEGGAPGDTSDVFAKSAFAYSPSRSRTFSRSGAGAASSPPRYEYRPATSHARTSAAATRRLDVASRTPPPPPSSPPPPPPSMSLLTPRPRRLRPSAPSPPPAARASPVSNLTHGSKNASQSSFASPRTAGMHRPGLFTKTGSSLDPAAVALFPLR